MAPYEVSYTIGTGYKYETKSVVPNVGLEPMTLRLTRALPTERARLKYNLDVETPGS